MRTPLEAKLRALGRVLADGVRQEDGKAGEATVLATALDDIEAPHIEVLRLLSEQPLPPPKRVRPGIDQAIGGMAAET